MAEFIEPGPICDTAGIREAVCIHTRKIFDSCRDKDIASLKVLPRPARHHVSVSWTRYWSTRSSNHCRRFVS